jgi:serine protease Do
MTNASRQTSSKLVFPIPTRRVSEGPLAYASGLINLIHKSRKLPVVIFSLLFLLPTSIAAAQDSTEELFENAVRAAVAIAAPSIVTIDTVGGLETATVKSGQEEGQLLLGTGPTAGLVVSEDGYVISSVFNFLSKPEAILVTLPSGKRAGATIVARDHARMLVLLKVDTEEKLVPPRVAKKSELQIGQTALAIGVAQGKVGHRISAGILSAQGRINGRALQTDARVSPANYGGPLVDLSGQVMGVVVPLSPQSQSEVAGLEWYDTGVGFAIPLEDLLARVDTLRQGKDVHAGILGVGMKPGDRFADPAVIGVIRPNSPASKAGFLVNDQILAVDGKPVPYMAAFSDAMGILDAGAAPVVKIKRGDKEIELTPTLIDKLAPYQHASLGLSLDRIAGPLSIRSILSGGPAEEARLRPKDVITHLAGSPVANRIELLAKLTALQPGENVPIVIQRGAENLDRAITLAPLTSVEQLEVTDAPPRLAAKDAKPLEKTGKQTLALAEERATFDVLIPAAPPPAEGFGLLMHLGAPASMNAENMEAAWGASAPPAGVIVLSPRPADATKWLPNEVQSVHKGIEAAFAQYPIDRARVVLVAERQGAMLALQASRRRDLIRGLAFIDAELPATLRPPENAPEFRQRFLFLTRDPGSLAKLTALLRAEGFPTVVPLLPIRGEKPIPIASPELFRWIDSLDAI